MAALPIPWDISFYKPVAPAFESTSSTDQTLIKQGRLAEQADMPGHQTGLTLLANLDSSGLLLHPFASIDKRRDELD